MEKALNFCGNPVNREEPDEMQHYAAFHQGLHCLIRLKLPSGTEIHTNFRKIYSLTGTFTNSIDPDEMLHFIRVYTVCKVKKDLQTKEYNFV